MRITSNSRLSAALNRADRDPRTQFVYNTNNVGKFATGKDKVGRIDAISVETGKTVWSWETRVSNYSPILATGGGLLFNGSMDPYLRALELGERQGLVADAAGGCVAGCAAGRRNRIQVSIDEQGLAERVRRSFEFMRPRTTAASDFLASDTSLHRE